MATEIDPAGIMPRAILGAADFREARVLEVGAGDGRLTFQYSADASHVVGIDTKEMDIRSGPLRQRHRFAVCRATVGDRSSGVFLVMSRSRGHGRCPERSTESAGGVRSPD